MSVLRHLKTLSLHLQFMFLESGVTEL